MAGKNHQFIWVVYDIALPTVPIWIQIFFQPSEEISYLFAP
jgi:hypothetical protein